MKNKKQKKCDNSNCRPHKSIIQLFRRFFLKLLGKGTEEDETKSECTNDAEFENASENKPKEPLAESLEERFLREWTHILSESADVFTGLYTGLLRTSKGKTKKPASVLREWRTRTRYQWEGQSIQEITDLCLPPDKEFSTEECKKWVSLLLQAAKEAGIEKDTADTLILDERRANAYTEWDGNEIYMEDTVEVLTPAWYLNGKIIEQGQCRKIEDES